MPLITAALKNNPDLARKRLRAVAEGMYERTKVRPSPAEVAEEAERLIRDEAATFGLQAPTKTNPSPKRNPARSLTDEVAPTTRPKGQRPPRASEDDDGTLAGLDELDAKARAKKKARSG